MDLQIYKTFLYVAEYSNITHAAEKLRFTQPAISAQIQTMERTLGVALFERIGKKIFLTEAGRAMVPLAERVLRLEADIMTAMQEYRGKKPTLRLGISTQMINYLLPPILADLQAELPDAAVNIEVYKNIGEVVDRLADNTIDVGMIHDCRAPLPFIHFQFWVEEIIWVGCKDLLARYKNAPINQLPLINFKRCGSVFRAKLDEAMREQPLLSTIEYSDSQAIKIAVLNGMGVSYLPKMLVEQYLENGQLVQIQDAPAMDMSISVIFHKNKAITPPIYHLLSVLSALPQTDAALQTFLKPFEKGV